MSEDEFEAGRFTHDVADIGVKMNRYKDYLATQDLIDIKNLLGDISDLADILIKEKNASHD